MWTIVCTFAWRCRGGFLGLGSTLAARLLYWCTPMTIWGYSTFGPMGILCGLTAYLGLLLSYAPFMGDNQAKHCAGMGGIGIARLFILLSPVLFQYPDLVYFGFAGAFVGLAYYIGWTYLDGKVSPIVFPGFVLFGKTWIQPGNFAIGGAEWGEVLTGAVTGLTLDCITILMLIKGAQICL